MYILSTSPHTQTRGRNTRVGANKRERTEEKEVKNSETETMRIPTTASVVAQLSCICAVVGLLLYSSLVAVPRVLYSETDVADGELRFSERRGTYRSSFCWFFFVFY